VVSFDSSRDLIERAQGTRAGKTYLRPRSFETASKRIEGAGTTTEEQSRLPGAILAGRRRVAAANRRVAHIATFIDDCYGETITLISIGIYQGS
jgi:hypothetical protein